MYGCETLPETGSRYQIQFAIIKDTATLYLDTSGEGLYKRGYRAVGVEAPCGRRWRRPWYCCPAIGEGPFCDPFCGSGTIPIEAALIAKNRAPGLDRSFDAQRWAFLPAKVWMDAADEAMDKEFHGHYDIWAATSTPCRGHCQGQCPQGGGGGYDPLRGGGHERLPPGQHLRPVGDQSPYGERLMEKREAEDLYRELGQVWCRLPEGWRTLVLSSHTEFERSFGRPAVKKRKLYNGMIKCDLFMYGNV